MKRSDKVAAVVGVLLAVAFVALITADSHPAHVWLKQSEVAAKNAYGQAVVSCTWQCVADPRNPHTTTTSGAGWCPMPAP